jgi:hypothetical protein
MGYELKAHFMDVVDEDAGFYQSGQPKKVIELRRGDDVPVDKIGEERLKQLVDSGAIEETKDDAPKEQPQEEAAPAPAAKATKSTS